MSPQEIAILGRVLERLLIVLLSGASLYFGYRLFSIVAAAKSDGEAELQGFKIRLTRVGPGVFFALFGATVLTFSVVTRMEIGSAKEGEADVIYWGQSAVRGDDSLVRSTETPLAGANTLLSLIDQRGLARKQDGDADRLATARKLINVLMQQTLDQRFGAGAYDRYKTLQAACSADPSSCQRELANSKLTAWYRDADEFATALSE